MSSASQHPQHLTSADMSMIMRVHMKACAKNRIVADSLDAERIAALLVREFQYGLCNEADLLAAFTADGVLRLSVPVGRMDQFIGNALHRWEVDGDTLSH
mgnify:CR=1 FL=1